MDSIRIYSIIFDSIRSYSTLYDSIRFYAILLILVDSMRFYLIVFGSSRFYPIVSARSAEKIFRFYSILFHSIRFYSIRTILSARSAKRKFFRLPPQASPPSQNLLYYLRKPPGIKTRILSHTTSASLSGTLPILLI